eukprot:2421275-Rhodomonas_salina.1
MSESEESKENDDNDDKAIDTEEEERGRKSAKRMQCRTKTGHRRCISTPISTIRAAFRTSQSSHPPSERPVRPSSRMRPMSGMTKLHSESIG